jgi:hypothetical protein
MKPTTNNNSGGAKQGDLDAASKLKETIAALERGDFSSQHPHGLATDTVGYCSNGMSRHILLFILSHLGPQWSPPAC